MDNEMNMPIYLSYIFVGIAILCFGFFSTPMKIKSVQKAKVDPMLIQFFMSVSIFLGCCLVVFIFPSNLSHFTWDWYGIFGSSIWLPGSCFSIFAIKLIGISIPQAIWSGMTIIISFLWGILLFKEKLKNLLLVIIGIVFLICGILIIALSDIDFNFKKKEKLIEEEEKDSLIKNKKNEKKLKRKKIINYCLGILFTFIMSMFNGSQMIPAKFDKGSTIYIFSFGIGQLILSSFFFLLYILIKTIFQKEKIEIQNSNEEINDIDPTLIDNSKIQLGVITKAQIKYGIIPGLLSGVLWIIGYYSQVFVVFSPLGLTIGYPLIQCCLFVSGISGMVFFKELNNIRKKIQFFVGSLLLVPGFFLLAFFGSK